ncbi:MAG: geranylgeranyl reductase family protein, partial [Thermodesulfobacteriota bacterium]
MYDAIVVGLGPAGSMAAYELSKKGLRVLGLDKASFPRFKSCGGCVSVKVDPIVDFDFSDLIEDTVNGISFTFKSKRRLDIDSTKPIAYNVSRDRFDSFLVDKARGAGAEVIEGARVKAIRNFSDGVEVDADGKIFKASYLIGADGAGGVVGREVLDMDYKESHLSITAEFPATPSEIDRLRGRCLVDFGSVPYGYGWIFPKTKTFSVGIAGYSTKVKGKLKGYFKSFTESHPVLRGLEGTETKGWFIPVYHGRDQKLLKGRTLVVGDAAHLVDPFLGEGIYYAMRSGQIAAEAVEGALSGVMEGLEYYGERVAEEFYSEFEANDGLVRLIYKYPRVWYRMVEMEPGVMEKYYNVLRGEMECEQFYRELRGRLVKKSWRALSNILR